MTVLAKPKATQALTQLVADNRLIAEYSKACRDELRNMAVCSSRCTPTMPSAAASVSGPAGGGVGGEKGRIDCGLAIIDTVPDEQFKGRWVPRLVNFYTDEAVIVLEMVQSQWRATRHRHRMGRPLMEPLIWNATGDKPRPLRLKKAIRALIDDYVRIVANATVALEFDTTPQKYLLGVTDEQYDAIMNDKFKTYVGSLLTATSLLKTENPLFGQLARAAWHPMWKNAGPPPSLPPPPA